MRLSDGLLRTDNGGESWSGVDVRARVADVGYRILPDHIRVRRSTVRRAEARLDRKRVEARRGPATWPAFFASLRATFAHWDHADTWRLRERSPGPPLAPELREEGKSEERK